MHISKIWAREVLLFRFAIELPDLHQLFGIGVRQRAYRHAVHDAVNDCASAYREPKRRNTNDRVTWTFTQEAHRQSKVAAKEFEKGHSLLIAIMLLDRFDRTKLQNGAAPCL